MVEVIKERDVVADGIATGYLEAGAPDAPCVVLLHDGAFGSDAESCWAPVIPILAAQFHVVAPDLIGHGRTRKLVAFDEDPMTMRVKHVAAFCHQLGIADSYAVGSSFGGGLILRGMSAGALDFKAGVSICGPGGLSMIGAAFAKLQNYEPTTEWARTVCDFMVGSSDGNEASIEDRLARSKAPGHFQALAAVRAVEPVVPAPEFDWRSLYKTQLGALERRILLIEGGSDDLLERGWADDLAALTPRAQVLVVPDGRHQPHLQFPTEVMNAIVAFLRE